VDIQGVENVNFHWWFVLFGFINLVGIVVCVPKQRLSFSIGPNLVDPPEDGDRISLRNVGF
jgi:hypothetical protein